MNPSLRLPFQERDPAAPSGTQAVAVVGLLDTGATINVLPYPVGLHLGLVWDQQQTPLHLTGNLAQAPARAVVIPATVGSFAPVRLAFAWTQIAEVPVLLGQVNFFMELTFVSFAAKRCLRSRLLPNSSSVDVP